MKKIPFFPPLRNFLLSFSNLDYVTPLSICTKCYKYFILYAIYQMYSRIHFMCSIELEQVLSFLNNIKVTCLLLLLLF